jgi:amino acid adenylation domain-containing protein
MPRAFVEFDAVDCDQAIHRRFEQQAMRRPQAPAVRLPSGDVCYADLNRAANRAARLLLANAECDRGPIALMLDQGYDSILWTLAILKTGCCYAPLDHRLPNSILRAIVTDLAPGALVASPFHQDASRRLAAGRFPVISTETYREPFSPENIALPIAPERLAYVFYTSGSTGTPKAVADSHRHVLHNVMRYTSSLKFASGDVMSLVQHPRFSGTVSTLFGALSNGAAVAPFDLQTDGLQSISRWARTTRVTVFHSVPSIFRHLSDPDGRFPDMRLIRLEGDGASARDVAHFRDNFQDACTLVNGMGATECGLVRQFFISTQTRLDVSAPVPIGYPVADMTVRVVAADGRTLPSGCAGEIVVESRFLADGYWRNPGLTAKKFVRLEDGIRRYLTGDLGRMRGDGCLTHLGRIDQQVRIAGESVVPSDVEKLLLEIPGVTQAAIRPFVDQDGERRLCAYLVAAADAGITTTGVRTQLGTRMARHLLPTAIVFLDAFPLTVDFKLDHQRLPQPERHLPLQTNDSVPPRTDWERQLVELWQDALDVRPGIHDNFFDLGGTSLSAARMCAAVEKSFGRRVPLATIHQAPTVEQLAAILANEAWTASQSSRGSNFSSTVVPLQPNGSKPPLFWFNWGRADFRLSRYLGVDQPVYGLQHQSQNGERAFHVSIEQIAAHYVDAIRAVRAVGPYCLAGLCIGGMVTFEMARQLRQQGEEVPLLVMVDPDPLNPKPETLRQRVSRHWRAVATLRLHEMSGYVRARFSRMTIDVHSMATRWWHTALIPLFSGRALPITLRPRYLNSVYQRAARAYDPQPYDGRVMLFTTRGQYRDGELGWSTGIAGRLEIQELATDHASVLREPYVQVLAERLSACLARIDGG